MKQVIKVNASSLPWMTCKYRWWLHVMQGWKAPRNKSSVQYGVAVHKFIDSMYKSGGNYAVALEAGKVSFNVPKIDDRRSNHLSDERHFISTCMNYWSTYLTTQNHHDILMLGDKPATEVTFEILYWEDDQYEVWLCGTVDKLVKIKGGCYAIGDYKTTSKWDVEAFFSEYEVSHQLRFYLLSLKLMGEMYPDTLLGKIGLTRCGVFIDGIFLKPEMNKNNYERSQVFPYSEDDMKMFKDNLDRCIRELIAYIKEGVHLREGLFNGACNAKYRCDFAHICPKFNPALEASLLKRDFIQKTYDPLHHND